MGQEGRERIPVRVSGVTRRKEGYKSLLRREHCRHSGGEAKLEREGQAWTARGSNAVEGEEAL